MQVFLFEKLIELYWWC